MTQKTFNLISWGSIAFSVGLVVLAWGSNVAWNIGSLSAYQWFPLFGLLAWIIMAEHYYLGSIRILRAGLTKPRYFKQITGYTVLASLLLHPGILAFKQSQVGAGKPPQSFVDYAGEGLALAVMLGSFSLLLFLSFELFERLKNIKFIDRNWWLVSLSQSLAMTLIWVHGLRLGGVLADGWFVYVWYFYGIALIPCFYIIHREDFKKAT